jgi:uncharacterized protein (TIGR04206 family)
MPVVLGIGLFLFVIGFMIAQSVFKTEASRIIGGILFGLGTVALAVALFFVGCLVYMKR